uniref:Uncharacterized protein n=1 Tax=Heterorhabditis bacteriophora TaxID=37862 RepID=A0A1I7WH40_HETBA
MALNWLPSIVQGLFLLGKYLRYIFRLKNITLFYLYSHYL